MKTTFATIAWMMAAVACAGEFTLVDQVDELDGSRELTIGIQCSDQTTAGIVISRLDDNTYGLGIIDTGLRLWIPDDMRKGPVKAARYRADNMENVRNVKMTITKKMLFVEITSDEAVEILKANKFIISVGGERFTAIVGDHRDDADRAISLIEGAAVAAP